MNNQNNKNIYDMNPTPNFNNNDENNINNNQKQLYKQNNILQSRSQSNNNTNVHFLDENQIRQEIIDNQNPQLSQNTSYEIEDETVFNQQISNLNNIFSNRALISPNSDQNTDIQNFILNQQNIFQQNSTSPINNLDSLKYSSLQSNNNQKNNATLNQLKTVTNTSLKTNKNFQTQDSNNIEKNSGFLNVNYNQQQQEQIDRIKNKRISQNIQLQDMIEKSQIKLDLNYTSNNLKKSVDFYKKSNNDNQNEFQINNNLFQPNVLLKKRKSNKDKGFLLVFKRASKIKHFKNQLIKFSYFKSLNYLTRLGFITVNDLAYPEVKIKNKRILSRANTFYKFGNQQYEDTIQFNCTNGILQKFFALIQAFNPVCYQLMIWDIFICVFSIFSLWMLPIEAFTDFSMEKNSLLKNQWNNYLIILFNVYIIDILVQFNTAVLIKGQIVTNHAIIAKNYIKKRFIYDFLVLITFIGIVFSIQNLKFLIVIKIKKYFQLLGKLEYQNIINQKLYAGLQIAKLFIITIFICHLSSLIYWFLGIEDLSINSKKTTWIETQGLEEAHWEKLYLEAFYFQLTTISTVGYGDILPQSDQEKVFVLFSMMFSSAIFAYILTSFGEILQDVNKQKAQQKKDVIYMNMILERKSIPKDMKNMALNYLVYKNSDSGQFMNMEEETQILNALPKQIKTSIILQANIQVINKIKIFESFSEETKKLLAQKLIEEKFQQDEIIQNDNYNSQEQLFQYKERAIYYLQYGTLCEFINVQQRSGHLKKVLRYIEQGSIIENNFFDLQRLSNRGLQTQSNCIIYSMKRSDFIKIIKNNQKDLEIFQEMHDQVSYKYERQNYKIDYCDECKINKHSIYDCPFLHYYPEITGLILKFNKSEDQQRLDQKIDRKKQHSLNTLIQLNLIELYANQIQIDMLQSTEQSDDDDDSEFDQDEHKKMTNFSEPRFAYNINKIPSQEKPSPQTDSALLQKEIKLLEEQNNHKKNQQNRRQKGSYKKIPLPENQTQIQLLSMIKPDNLDKNNQSIEYQNSIEKTNSAGFQHNQNQSNQAYQTQEQISQKKISIKIQDKKQTLANMLLSQTSKSKKKSTLKKRKSVLQNRRDYKIQFSSFDENIDKQQQFKSQFAQKYNQTLDIGISSPKSNLDSALSPLKSPKGIISSFSPKQNQNNTLVPISKEDQAHLRRASVKKTITIQSNYNETYYQNQDLDIPFQFKYYKVLNNFNAQFLALYIQNVKEFQWEFGKYTYFNWRKYKKTNQNTISSNQKKRKTMMIKNQQIAKLQSQQQQFMIKQNISNSNQ